MNKLIYILSLSILISVTVLLYGAIEILKSWTTNHRKNPGILSIFMSKLKAIMRTEVGIEKLKVSTTGNFSSIFLENYCK